MLLSAVMRDPHVISPLNHTGSVGATVTEGAGVSDGAALTVGANVGAARADFSEIFKSRESPPAADAIRGRA